MTQQLDTLRPAMTAIAVVIALTATPALAQSAETPAPIAEATPSPAPESPDPLAPEASTPEPVASETTAAPVATARPAARANRPAARATTRRTTDVTRTRTAAPVAVEAAPAVPGPIDPLLMPPEMAAPAPIAAPAEPIPEAAPVAIDRMAIEEALPYAGAAGLGLLMLAGTGIVMRRRRRRREDAIEAAKWQYIEAQPDSAFQSDPAPAPAPVIAPAPTFVRTPQADPVPAAATGAAELPGGPDVSRFGRHVQAAYAGPTPDNPSASLKRRLTVGHFLDQKEAEAASATAPGKPAEQPAPLPSRAARNDSDFMLWSDKQPPRLKPAYQK